MKSDERREALAKAVSRAIASVFVFLTVCYVLKQVYTSYNQHRSEEIANRADANQKLLAIEVEQQKQESERLGAERLDKQIKLQQLALTQEQEKKRAGIEKQALSVFHNQIKEETPYQFTVAYEPEDGSQVVSKERHANQLELIRQKPDINGKSQFNLFWKGGSAELLEEVQFNNLATDILLREKPGTAALWGWKEITINFSKKLFLARYSCMVGRVGFTPDEDEDGRVTIGAVNSEVEQAGVSTGDLICWVGDKSCFHKTKDEVSLMLYGLEGSEVYVCTFSPESTKHELALVHIGNAVSGRVGIGLPKTRDKEAGYITIDAVLPNSPASRAGIKKDDVLVSIDGNSVEDMTIEAANRMLLGPVGSTIVVEVRHYQRFSATRIGGPSTGVAVAGEFGELTPVGAR